MLVEIILWLSLLAIVVFIVQSGTFNNIGLPGIILMIAGWFVFCVVVVAPTLLIHDMRERLKAIEKNTNKA